MSIKNKTKPSKLLLLKTHLQLDSNVCIHIYTKLASFTQVLKPRKSQGDRTNASL